MAPSDNPFRQAVRVLGLYIRSQLIISAIETLLREETTRGRLRAPLPPRDLAYLIVRIVESFLYADIITGEQLDIAKAEQAITALLVRD